MKLWQKENPLNKTIETFTIGKDRELDLLLAKYDIIGSLAHIKMLESIDLLTKEELSKLEIELNKLLKKTKDGTFEIEEGIEDVHSQVELELTRNLGDIGKKIHSGRSRNDQVLVDLRLFFRAEILSIGEEIKALFEVLIEKSEELKDVLMPGYTHLQVAMVSSFGLWLGGYAETLVDDLRLLKSVYKITNQNPLGSAAGYGNSFPLNRKMTTDLLGFDDLNYNVIHAQLGRGKTELFLSFALASIGNTLSKLAMDVCLFCNQNYDFIKFPDELTTGSSIMPHKKNPDVFELIRAKSNKLQALPTEISMITSSLPSGYHRDFQLIKEAIFPAISEVKNCLKITAYALQFMKVREGILKEEKYKYIYSVEAVNQKVLDGMPFRDAYQAVGQDIANGEFEIPEALNHTHEGSLGNLCNEEIREKWEKVWKL
ncbi:MAG: argininosuccinate lyase [Bacteroidetes bacterium]|jgi:argininosuccinate lyase|nr:argininosuccinate lyase [Bacteroidota bacterium]MDF1863419.1 argininosuccinate lyase [Saprospiraceae bacterium]